MSKTESDRQLARAAFRPMTESDRLLREALTADRVRALTTTSTYRKTALTEISDTTFPPGTPFQTPEGLRAEDEETRAAFDIQGGVYPIRESVFRASYEPAIAALEAAPSESDRLRELLTRLDGWYQANIVGEAYETPAEMVDVARRDLRAALAAPSRPTTGGLDRDPDDESGTFPCYCGGPDPGSDGNCRTCDGATYRLSDHSTEPETIQTHAEDVR